MKLVDILARDLEDWPDCDEIFQDYDGELRYIGHPVSTRSNCFVEMCDDLIRPRYGCNIKGVTRDQWQEARDTPINSDAKEWNGEGLPPVGIDVEFSVAGDERWIEGEVLYSSLYTVVISGNGFEHVHHPKAVKFRPVRTPEQIAAEKECAEIKELAMATGLRAGAGQMEVARAIYKAGYRKQVAK